jgi:hypothetical protein
LGVFKLSSSLPRALYLLGYLARLQALERSAHASIAKRTITLTMNLKQKIMWKIILISGELSEFSSSTQEPPD